VRGGEDERGETVMGTEEDIVDGRERKEGKEVELELAEIIFFSPLLSPSQAENHNNGIAHICSSSSPLKA